MREVKFRAWIPDIKLFEYFTLEQISVKNTIPWETNPDIQLYTGLKDRNGKEIYEFDHLDFNCLEYEIVFEHGGWLAKCLTTGPNPDGSESKRPDEWLADFNKMCVVVGNKYETR